ATAICWSIAPSVVTRFRATTSLVTLPAAAALLCTHAHVPTFRICSTRPSAASLSSGAEATAPPFWFTCSSALATAPACLPTSPPVISSAGCNIHNLESRPDRLNAQIDANLEIQDRRQLESILASIRRVAGVYGVERVYQT